MALLTLSELVLLGAIWGASFLFLRIAAPQLGIAPLVEVRLVLGAAVLLPLLWRERALLPRLPWLKLTGIGLINSALPFVVFSWAAQRAPAGVSALSNALVVPFAALLAWMLYAEPVTARRACGLAAGLLGIAVLAGDRIGGGSVWPAALAGSCGAFMYALAVNLVRQHLKGLPAGATAAATLVGPALFTLPAAWATWPTRPLTLAAWLAAALLGVLCTGTAYVVYYRLIHRIGAPRAATVTYLVPLFGVFWAWLVLGEPVTARMALSGGLILGGVALTQRA
ncbi:MAG: DMT family transporter [Steroidobacteraceae bacterium]